MGFRNPVSSVSDVNTGDPLSGAGVHVYETTDSTGYPYGLVEFDDGVAGDLPASVVGKADYNPRAAAQTIGGGLYLKGGSYNPAGAGLIAAPELDLRVVQNGDGSFSPLAQLLGAALSLADGYAPGLSGSGALIGTPPARVQPLIRIGSQLVTANAASFAAITWPAFPSGLFMADPSAGDYASGVGSIIPSAYRLSGADIRLYSAAGGNLANGTSVRVNYVAVGW